MDGFQKIGFEIGKWVIDVQRRRGTAVTLLQDNAVINPSSAIREYGKAAVRSHFNSTVAIIIDACLHKGGDVRALMAKIVEDLSKRIVEGEWYHPTGDAFTAACDEAVLDAAMDIIKKFNSWLERMAAL